MFTKDQINTWIEMYATSDNVKDFEKSADSFNLEERDFGKRDLVEAKVMVDRWGVVITDWIFPSSKKEVINRLFPEDESKYHHNNINALRSALKILLQYSASLEEGTNHKEIGDVADKVLPILTTGSSTEKTYHIWGANVHFTDDIDPSKAIGLSLDEDTGRLIQGDSNKLENSIIMFNIW